MRIGLDDGLDHAWLAELVGALGGTAADARWHERRSQVAAVRHGPGRRSSRTVRAGASRDAGLATRVWTGRRREDRHLPLPEPNPEMATVLQAPLTGGTRCPAPPCLPTNRGSVTEGWTQPPDLAALVATAAEGAEEARGSTQTMLTVRQLDHTVAVANTSGALTVSTGTWLSLDVEVNAAGTNSAGRLLEPGEDPREVVGALVAALADEATARLEPPACDRSTVVVDPELAGLLAHELVGHALEGDANVDHRPWAQPGERIAGEDITIRDDPSILCPYGRVWDHEGSLSVPVALVVDGVVHGRLHSLSSSQAMGQRPTGHARAIGWSHPPIPRMSTTFFTPGPLPQSELFERVSEGLYLYGARGGDGGGTAFWACSQGSARIRNGKLDGRCGPILLHGDPRDFLSSIVGVGADWTLFAGGEGGCGKLGQFPFPVASGGGSLLVASCEVTPLGKRARP